MPIDARRWKTPGLMTTVHRNNAGNSLHAARQLYGPDAAAATLERPDVFCAAQAEATSRFPSEKGQLCSVRRRKRPRSTQKHQQLDAQSETPTGLCQRVPSKAAQPPTALRPANGEAYSGINDHAVHAEGPGCDFQMQLSDNQKKSDNSSGGIPAACTPEGSECTASVGTASVDTASVGTVSVGAASISATVGRSSQQKVRDGRRQNAAGLKPVGARHSGPTKHAHDALNGTSSLSLREENRQMRLLMPGEQGEINHVLRTFATQIDGRSMRTRDFFNLVSTPQHIEETECSCSNFKCISYALRHFRACLNPHGDKGARRSRVFRTLDFQTTVSRLGHLTSKQRKRHRVLNVSTFNSC